VSTCVPNTLLQTIELLATIFFGHHRPKAASFKYCFFVADTAGVLTGSGHAHSSGIFAFSNLFFIHVPVSSSVRCLKITFVIAPHFDHFQNGAPSHVTR
jgi:hypothetical protein